MSKAMSKTAVIGLASSTLFGRFLAMLDRVLSARAAIRNGELPYFGL
jgi:hypothetical protein